MTIISSSPFLSFIVLYLTLVYRILLHVVLAVLAHLLASLLYLVAFVRPTSPLTNMSIRIFVPCR